MFRFAFPIAPRSRRLLVGLAAVCALGVLSSSRPAPGAAAPLQHKTRANPLTVANSSAATATRSGNGILGLGGRLNNFAGLSRYSLVIGDSADAHALTNLPGRSLTYFSGTDVNTGWSTGVPYKEALANGWLLKDAAGQLLVNQGYASNYIGDVGSPSYQHAWVSHVLAYLAAHRGIKGVFVDDVLFDLKPLAGTEAAKYPTQAAWAAAQRSFVAAIGTALRAKGYYVLVNADGYVPGSDGSDNGSNTVTWWKQLGPYVSGLMNEGYQQLPDGTDALRTSGSASWTQNWDGWQRLVQTAQAMHKDFVGITYGASNDTRTMTYGKASFMLAWNGGTSAFIYSTRNGVDPANGAWTMGIGRPVASAHRVGSGWMRSYSNGLVLVNPSPSGSQTFQLGGEYVTESGATVSSLTLSGTDAAILRAPKKRH